jgi:protein TonB
MRAAAPWVISLLLHSFFLLGIALLARVPPEVPLQLALDFQIVPRSVATVKEPVPSAEPPSVENTPVPAESVPAPIEKPPPVAEEPLLPPPPETKTNEPLPPVLKIKEAKPTEIVEAVVPQPQQRAMEALPATVPTEVVQPTVVAEKYMMSPATSNSDSESEAEEAARQAETISHVRGLVLNKLEYPAVARRRGWCGKLVLGFVLCADGSVENLVVLESTGHGILDRAAMKSVVKTAPFSGGYPRTTVRLPINFQLN